MLALHGGDSNSNIMRFQTAPLRKALGADVEWLFPDGLEPGHPQSEIPEDLYHHQSTGRSRWLEERISEGKPYLCWWKYELNGDVPDGWAYRPSSCQRAIAALEEYLAREGPVDAVVAFSQGAFMLAAMAQHLKKAGSEVPWRVNLVFHSAGLNPGHLPDIEEPLAQPTYFITCTADLTYYDQVRTWRQYCRSIGFLLHEDGFCFPSTAPLAARLYAHLAEEVRRHCGLAPSQAPGIGAGRAAGPTQGPGDVDELRAVPVISPDDFMALLHSGGCAVVDCRDSPAPFPGAERGIGARTLRTRPRALVARLAVLRADGRLLVVVSATDEDCRECCAALVGEHGFAAEGLRRLEGGLAGCAPRALEREAASSLVGTALPAGVAAASAPAVLAGAAAAVAPSAVTAAELAELLRAEGCLVADAREPDEGRGGVFPGAQRGLGLLLLRRRPEEARRRLRRLLEDGRPVVAVSETGTRCQDYCRRLVRDFGFEAGRARWLEGGHLAWDVWAEEHGDLAAQVRRQCGLLPRPGRRPARDGGGGGDGGVAAARERSLDVLAQA